MSRRDLLHTGAVLGAGALASGLPLGHPAFAQAAVEDWPRVAEMVRSHVRGGKVANMVAALGWAQRDPEYLAAGHTTFTSTTPVGPDSLYRIYSMTKPITGMAAMICIDEGLLALDQPLAEILPAFADMQVQREYDGAITADNLEPAVRPITIRQLLTHTAGLSYSIVQQGPISEALVANGLIPGQLSRLPMAQAIFGGEPVGSLAAFADGLAQMPLVYQPGTRWSYSVGLDLIGRVIEVVTGQDFAAFLQQRIFDPCGMDSTFFRVPASEQERLTANYFLLNDTLLPLDLPDNSIYLDDPAFPMGGAGLVSSARDYDRFLQMLAGGGEIGGVRVMSDAAVRMGTSDLLPDTLAPDGGFSSAGREFGYGAGGLVGRGDAAGLFGWFGAAGTTGLVNLRWGLRHTLMTQYMPAESYDVQTAFPVAVAADAIALLQRR